MTDRTFRIIFMGTPDFATPALDKLIHGPDEIVAVVSQPDRKKGRGRKLAPPPVKILAEQHGLEVLQPTKIKTDEFVATLSSYDPDLIIVVAYGRILPKSILELPPLGCINVHGSLLPQHRGAAPIQWAVIKGDSKAGVTIMNMEEGMDTGDILLQTEIAVEDADTAGSLFARLSRLGGETLMQALDLLRQGRLAPTSQDHALSTMAPPLKKEDGCIDWSKSAHELHCLIRGLDPWPMAYSFLGKKRIRLFSPEVIYKDSDQPAGTILKSGRDGIMVATGENCLLIRELQPEGKKRMTAQAFLCGQPLNAGSRFTTEQTTTTG